MRRRSFLQLAGTAAGAYAIGARAGAPALRPKRRVLAIFATGGWDTTFALDPKDPADAAVPAGAVTRFETLDVFCDASRPSVTAFFERYAGAAAIIRGIATDAINHNECQRRIATGTREETRPDFAAILAHDLGAELPLPYLVLGETAWSGPYASCAGRVGGSNQIVGLLDSDLSTAEAAVLRAYTEGAVQRERAIRGAAGYNRRRLDDFSDALQRSDRIRAAREKFGSRGETLSYDAQLGLAVDALAQDLSHAVTVSTRLPWDTHASNHLQGDYHEATFAGLVRTVDALAARPGRATGTTMLDDTTVVVFSEMSRTPWVNTDPNDPEAGKNHWPITSALVVGAGVKSGVYGATGKDSGALAIDFATGAASSMGDALLYSHFVAGILALCGTDSKLHLEARAFDAFVA